jgi:hypothetical protein
MDAEPQAAAETVPKLLLETPSPNIVMGWVGRKGAR